MLEVKGVHKRFGEDAYPLRGVDLFVDKSECVFLMGRSGSGKSTLANCLSGIDILDSGEIFIDKNKIDYNDEKQLNNLRKNDIGIVFQQFYLLSKTSVYNQIALTSRASDEEIDFILSSLDILDLKYRSIETCSGGQQQRVSIARALAKRPKIILADEPTANLDLHLAIESVKLMIKISKEVGSALIVITHDDRITYLADRILNLDKGVISSI